MRSPTRLKDKLKFLKNAFPLRIIVNMKSRIFSNNKDCWSNNIAQRRLQFDKKIGRIVAKVIERTIEGSWSHL